MVVPREGNGTFPRPGFRAGVAAPFRGGAARALRDGIRAGGATPDAPLGSSWAGVGDRQVRVCAAALRYAWGRWRRGSVYTELCRE